MCAGVDRVIIVVPFTEKNVRNQIAGEGDNNEREKNSRKVKVF